MNQPKNCRYCHRPLKQLYPDAPFRLQWAHTSLEDARDCGGRGQPDMWPIPVGDSR